MTDNYKLHQLPKLAKFIIGFFLLTLSFGYYTGLRFVNENTNNSIKGIEEHYLGNEENENAKEMKFKKSEKEIVTTIHNHVISMSIIFLVISGLLFFTDTKLWLKKILCIEPFISILLTFGGIWLLWSGVVWFKYIIIISGTLLTLSYTASVIVLYLQLFKSK